MAQRLGYTGLTADLAEYQTLEACIPPPFSDSVAAKNNIGEGREGKVWMHTGVRDESVCLSVLVWYYDQALRESF